MLVILFVIIAILLIYSLLMISIETKTFEFGVMRLTGLSSRGLISLIAIQAILFVLPAIIAAFILSVPIIAVFYNYTISGSGGYNAPPIPSGSSSLLALALGLFIPAVSAMIPIQRALSKNLNDSINVQRSKISGILVTVFDRNNGMMLPFVLVGSICVFGGTSIYYFLPKGFLLMDYALLLNMFFLILSGMIAGLILLVNNL